MKVLLVDDEPDILEQAKIFLEKEKDQLDVVTTTSPPEALEMVKSNEVEAIISNYQMPEMNGLKFLKKLRDQDNNIPFIMFTGRGREEVAMEALNLGANRYFQKGDDPRTLYGMLADAVVREIGHRHAEENYQNLFEGISDVVFVCDSNLNLLDVNSAAYGQLGYSKEELLKMGVQDILADDQVNKIERIQDLIKRGNTEESKEIIFQCEQVPSDGERIPVEVSCSSIKYRGTAAALCVARNISERRITEETVRNATSAMISQIGSEDLFQKIVDNARKVSKAKFVILSLYDEEKKTVKVKAVSGESPSITDSISNILGAENLFEIEFNVEGAPRFKKFSEKKEKEPVALDGFQEYTFGMFDEKTCRSIEEVTEIEEIIAIPLLNNEGELVGILGYLFPEERKERNHTSLMIFADFASQAILKSRTFEQLIETREKLRKNKKRYRTLTEAADEIILTHDIGEAEITYANNSAAEQLGYEVGELIGMSLYEIIPDDEIDKIKEIEKNRKSGDLSVYHVETKGLRKDRTVFPVKASSKPISVTDSEKPEEVLVIARDITNQKRSEEKEEFLHSLLRHDVKNKAQIARGYLELLQKEDLPEKTKDYVEKMEKVCEEAVEIIEKVRKLRGIEKETEIGEVELREVVENVIKEHKDQLTEANVELNCQDHGHKVRGGPLLEELFSNILENAIRHSGCKKIRIHSHEQEGECIVTVEDDGCGIPKEDREKIFKKGYRKGEAGNSGLGLYLVKKIAENYRGSVKVRDSELGGARLDVHLKKI